MSYQVLARKYRPQRFEDVVSQEHITRALANAVTSGRLAHAILLSGPRGTGKTTIARILAKCVNCESGPGATPCNVCRSCQDITSGHAAEVFEIDGASNNKVENIREIRDNAHYMPAYSPFKIYIIDEVHMLSDSAFNALLKIFQVVLNIYIRQRTQVPLRFLHSPHLRQNVSHRKLALPRHVHIYSLQLLLN